MVKNLLANAEDERDMGLIPVSGRSHSVGNGNPIQYTCLEHSMDRGAWWATIYETTESDSDMTEHICNALSNYPLHFHRTRANNPKIYVKPQKIQNCQSHSEGKE